MTNDLDIWQMMMDDVRYVFIKIGEPSTGAAASTDSTNIFTGPEFFVGPAGKIRGGGICAYRCGCWISVA